ncbi:MAG TPA: methyltransferase domain-containing protein [Sphingomicrobium sp.]|nr:methyltransferase domain-containing protein [Sphingomicrobium sp.]
MSVAAFLRSKIKAARKRGALWVRLLDIVRLLAIAEGRSRLKTRAIHAREMHQTTSDTWEERYPDLFDLAAELSPDARRILSFGCSTGEELISLRRRFPEAEIVGVEINPRSRRIAAQRIAPDRRASVHARLPNGDFDIIFVLAVLQREPHKIAEMNVADLTPYYPFEKFDAAVVSLAGRLRTGGLLCMQHSHYRVEDSSATGDLEPIESSPPLDGVLFGRDGRRLKGAAGRTMFRNKSD